MIMVAKLSFERHQATTAEELEFWHAVEAYINAIDWSRVSENERTLAVGNMRGIASFLKRKYSIASSEALDR